MNNSNLLISIIFLNIICISLLCAMIRNTRLSKASPIPETEISMQNENTEISESETTTKETTAAKTTVTTTVATTAVKITTPYIKKNLGNFDLTFYVPDDTWGYSTSTGVKSTHLKTCAVDPNIIPLGSTIQIVGDNGQILILKAVDIGGGIRGNKIDIFWDGSINAGYDWLAKFGTVQEVYLLEE